MFCTNCLSLVYEVGYDIWEGGEEKQFSGCVCNEISSLVFDWESGVKFVGLALTPGERERFFGYSPE